MDKIQFVQLLEKIDEVSRSHEVAIVSVANAIHALAAAVTGLAVELKNGE
jgi:hypothetical protein